MQPDPFLHCNKLYTGKELDYKCEAKKNNNKCFT